jgi:hypothetical protein
MCTVGYANDHGTARDGVKVSVSVLGQKCEK